MVIHSNMKTRALFFRNFLSGLLILLFIIVSSPCAFTASVETMGLTELVNASDRIVVGKCASSHCEWLGNKIVTKTVIAVGEHLKGNRESSYTVTTLGGTAVHPTLNAPITMTVPGGLAFRPDEDVVLFTKKNHLGQNQVVGLTQGKFVIKTDSKTGKRFVPLAEKKLHSKKLARDLTAPHGKSDSAGDRVISQDVIGLSEFVERVKQRVAKGNHD